MMMSVSADRSVLERLRTDLRGTLVLEGDADYDTARQAWNLAVDQHPVAVATPADVPDVQAIMAAAREGGYGVTTQPNGHGADGDQERERLVAQHHDQQAVVERNQMTEPARAQRMRLLLHAQRSLVRRVHHAAPAVAEPRGQRQPGVPVCRVARAQRRAQNPRCSAAISCATAGTGPMTSIAFWPRANSSRHGRSSVGFSVCAPV